MIGTFSQETGCTCVNKPKVSHLWKTNRFVRHNCWALYAHVYLLNLSQMRRDDFKFIENFVAEIFHSGVVHPMDVHSCGIANYFWIATVYIRLAISVCWIIFFPDRHSSELVARFIHRGRSDKSCAFSLIAICFAATPEKGRWSTRYSAHNRYARLPLYVRQ